VFNFGNIKLDLEMFLSKKCLSNSLLPRHSILALMIYFDLVSMIDNILVAGVTPAERLLELYNGKWGQSVDPVFEELLY
jgi:hypothetical protein